eukprot:362399-Chlamydomonas_euryale.AAC.4
MQDFSPGEARASTASRTTGTQCRWVWGGRKRTESVGAAAGGPWHLPPRGGLAPRAGGCGEGAKGRKVWAAAAGGPAHPQPCGRLVLSAGGCGKAQEDGKCGPLLPEGQRIHRLAVDWYPVQVAVGRAQRVGVGAPRLPGEGGADKSKSVGVHRYPEGRWTQRVYSVRQCGGRDEEQGSKV